MKLSNLIVDSFIQKFSEKENFCAFSLPYVFRNGSPAILNAFKHPNGDIELTDNGLNLQAFSESISRVDFDVVAKAREFTLNYPNIHVRDGALLSITSEDDLTFDLLDYSDVLKKMIEFHPKQKSDHVEKILDQLRVILEKNYNHLNINPEIQGRSGGKYKFNFGTENQLIDFSEVNKRRTNDLLRKYVDTQNFNSDLSFMVILDDLENDKYKSEQSILAEYAVVKPLTSMLRI
ncbi:hypothetical protein [Acinetobacter johnsonii]|uniref:hypothetical protein n=1 Tax=Acinetobacter johnsonii TaxID=40214 RepID=UPI00124FB3F8|nr:hypothetical protein [Acinetobacter johnsonii]